MQELVHLTLGRYKIHSNLDFENIFVLAYIDFVNRSAPPRSLETRTLCVNFSQEGRFLFIDRFDSDFTQVEHFCNQIVPSHDSVCAVVELFIVIIIALMHGRIATERHPGALDGSGVKSLNGHRRQFSDALLSSIYASRHPILEHFLDGGVSVLVAPLHHLVQVVVRDTEGVDVPQNVGL